jgi:hypothetical protein
MLFKILPEVEYAFNKTTDVMVSTIDFNTVMTSKSIDYFNQVTDRMFYTWTVQAIDAINKVSNYAKENITESKTKIVDLFGNTK